MLRLENVLIGKAMARFTMLRRQFSFPMLVPLDVNVEKLIPLSAISDRLGIAYTTVWRWIRTGNNGIALAARKVGGRWYTSEEAFQRYCDASTTASLGAGLQVDETNRLPTPRQQSKISSERQRLAERGLRMAGIDGDASVFNNTTASKELACDLHEFLEEWLPGVGAVIPVRSGIFRHAVEILEGKHGKSRSFAAAKSWIESLDLRTFDVRSLYGVGPFAESDWKDLLRNTTFVAQLPQPKTLLASAGTPTNQNNS